MKKVNSLSLSVLVPCYRDEMGLDELHRRLTVVCCGLTNSYEIVLVEDGSPDATWSTICQLAEKIPESLAYSSHEIMAISWQSPRD